MGLAGPFLFGQTDAVELKPADLMENKKGRGEITISPPQSIPLRILN